MVLNSQVIAPILDALDAVGLNHSCTMGRAIIVEGGLSDKLKATAVDSFRDALTDSKGFINILNVRTKMLPARRALLKHVAGVLQTQGIVLRYMETFHNPSVDEIYHLVIEGEEVDLILMPN